MSIFRGRVVSFDSGTWTATIRLDGSSPQTLTTIATARNIASAEMTAGRRVLMDTGDHSDPTDFVVTTVYG
jgi:molybdopterin-binding protein